MLAIVLAVLGVAGSSYFAEGDARASNPLLGNLLMFGAVLSSSGYAVCVRFISRRYSLHFRRIKRWEILGQETFDISGRKAQDKTKTKGSAFSFYEGKAVFTDIFPVRVFR